MNRRPNRSTNWTLRSRAARQRIELVQSGHVVDRYCDFQRELFRLARVHDGYRTEDLSYGGLELRQGLLGKARCGIFGRLFRGWLFRSSEAAKEMRDLF